jgi:NADH:ubiquinone reductase (H+-translocating)
VGTGDQESDMNRLLKGGLAVACGGIAAGAVWRMLYHEPQPKYEPWERPPYDEFPNRVLIVGGGFAGFTVAKTLAALTEDRDDVGIMVVSRENFFTYWPMVAGIISSDVEAKNIAQPLRRSLIQYGASFRRAELEDVDLEQKVVKAKGGLEFSYDHLVLALGSDPAFFGVPGVEEHCISMRGLADAERIRNRMIERFEEVTLEGDEADTVDYEPPKSKLTFVIVGGNATGVEIASELHTLAHETLAPDYPTIDMNRVRIVLVDSNEEVLKELDDALRRAARRHLEELGVEVINNARAQEVTADRVILDDGEEIEAENVIWTAGNRASVKVDELDLPLQGEDGIETDEYMRVPGAENVWSIGDCAANVDKDGEPIPSNAQAATQEGEALAKNILAAIDGDELVPFEYKPMGQLVELGSQFAVNEVMGVKFSGLPAALFWRAAYLFKLEIPENRARIAADWFLDLFFHPSVTQIRGREGA